MTGPSRRQFVAAAAGVGTAAAVLASAPSASSARGALAAGADPVPPASLTADVTLAPGTVAATVTGRVYVVLTTDDDAEPREQVGGVADGVPFWGLDVAGLVPGGSTRVPLGAPADGFPARDASALPPGTYRAQAFLNVYTHFSRSDGAEVDLHLPGGDGHDVFDGTGNLCGPVVEVTLPAGPGGALRLVLDRVLPPREPVPAGGTAQQGNPGDSEHVRHVKVRSAALSRFWGRDVFVGADVLLPPGYDDPANAGTRYPVEVNHGHFPQGAPRGFTEDGSTPFGAFWLSGTAPAFIVVAFRHENPYYDDSYAVDSANLGPYGTALNTELLPEVDRLFRTVGQPWARVLSGGSTGGWEAAATQVFHPDLYGGAWIGYPDPLDFHALELVDVYGDDNAYVTRHAYLDAPVPAAREVSGKARFTTAQENARERALGSRGRSGLGQWDVWQAVFSPCGEDGYPAPIWDKTTGVVDHAVARYWEDHYDLAAHVERNWDDLRARLDGKLTIYVGDADTFFLNVGVDRFKERVDRLEGSNVTYHFGRNQPHGWSPWSIREFYDLIADHVVAHAPAADQPAAAAWRAGAAPADGTGSEAIG
ncbi:enterochelin esterase-like enzyme [Kineococcus sp. R8]|uniref:esterase family protein n=1 Tax=Kineococcus siccus TaxID=2696567 RepID=UPI001412E3BB|nr:esterase family protein [Kineococcus siccus]NAZ80214.1 enterochelin esterase-like enzyme [Kineococcus siccus]